MDFSIVFSGGGIRGATHVGALLALEENGLYPKMVGGTSAGSVVAGLYAYGYNAKELVDIVKDMCKHKRLFLDYDNKSLIKSTFNLIFRKKVTYDCILKGNYLEKYINDITKGKRITDCTKGILIPTLDIISQNTIVYTNCTERSYNDKNTCNYVYGNNEVLSKVIRSSCSFPGIFKPVKINNMVLVDGGVTNNLPVNLMLNSCGDNILAIDVSKKVEKIDNPNVINTLYTSFGIMSTCLKKLTSVNETVLLYPTLPDDANLLSFDKMEECMEIGYNHTLNELVRIKSVLNIK